MKLFCFPYAGGSATFYDTWKPMLPPCLELEAIELGGRGRRIFDALPSSIEEIVSDTLEELMPKFYKQPYVLFGHSMGGIIVYELARRIAEEKIPMPNKIFISGKGALHLPRRGGTLHNLPKEEFKKKLIALGGVNEDFFKVPELANLFLPVIINDLRLAETYLPGHVSPLACDITLLFGKSEDFVLSDIQEWEMYTKGICRRHFFTGGHFFIKNHTQQIIDLITESALP